MPLLDKQRRGQVIGRIRTGRKNANGYPMKVETLIFTSGNRRAIETIANLYGGTVEEWDVRPGQYIVQTDTAEVDVVIPPRDEVVSQWYEMWTKAGCARRCDSVTNQITGEACPCPSDPARRAELAKMNPPQACAPRTRINVWIADAPGMGVWTLATGSDQAAAEINDAADLLTMARDQGVMLPATLRLEQRETRTVGEAAKRYGVICLEPHNTFREIVSGELTNATVLQQLPPVPRARLALTAGPDRTGPYIDRSAPVAGPPTAKQLAAAASFAATREEIDAIADTAGQHLLLEELVMIEGAEEELGTYLRHLWKKLPHAGSQRQTVLAHAAADAAGADDGIPWPDVEP